MRQRIKVNEEWTQEYQALHNTAGLTDLYMHVYDNNGNEVNPSNPIAMTDKGDGRYEASFTPTAEGLWRILIESDSNNDNIETSFDVVRAVVTDVKTDTENISADTTTIKNDTATLKDGQTQIENKLQSIDDQISPGGYLF